MAHLIIYLDKMGWMIVASFIFLYIIDEIFNKVVFLFIFIMLFYILLNILLSIIYRNVKMFVLILLDNNYSIYSIFDLADF